MPENDDEADRIREDCWDTALHSFGYSFLFKRRYRIYRAFLRILLFIGFATPLAVGALALSFGLNQWVIWVASAIGILQIIVNLWAVIGKFDDVVVYSQKAATEHNTLCEGFRSLGKNPPKQKTKLRHDHELLHTRLSMIVDSDNEQAIKPKELRRAHRAGLREFRRECSKCGFAPSDMKSTDCGVCGRFRWFDPQHA